MEVIVWTFAITEQKSQIKASTRTTMKALADSCRKAGNLRISGAGPYLAFGLAECSTINKIPETDIRVQPEGQKSNEASHWFLPLPMSEMAIHFRHIVSFRNLRMRLYMSSVSSCLISLYKGVHHYHPVLMAN